jgi:hypothetical protein
MNAVASRQARTALSALGSELAGELLEMDRSRVEDLNHENEDAAWTIRDWLALGTRLVQQRDGRVDVPGYHAARTALSLAISHLDDNAAKHLPVPPRLNLDPHQHQRRLLGAVGEFLRKLEEALGNDVIEDHEKPALIDHLLCVRRRIDQWLHDLGHQP